MAKGIIVFKPKDCDLVVLGIGEDYAKGLLSITFHSSRMTIYVSAGSAQTPQKWMRVKWTRPSCGIVSIYRLEYDNI